MKTFEIITLCLKRVIVKNCKDFKEALKKADLEACEIASIKELHHTPVCMH